MQTAAKPAQFLLYLRSEALLFVDYQQTKILEADIPRGDCVRADDNSDPAVAQPPLDLASLSRACGPRQQLDPDVKSGEAAAKGTQMLSRQNRGRDDDGDLLPAQHRGCGGAQCHLGLAEADIAA